MFKRFSFVVIAIFFLQSVFTKSFAANNSRSDTIDILHQTINLNITDFTTHIIGGYCKTSFKSKMNGVNELLLDLQGFTVDSVIQNGNELTFTNDGLLLTIQLQNVMNQNDTSSVTVFYQGVPAADASWGGFYWSGNYGFNLGVAFQSVPHNFGRAWFPCFDNFVERSTYTLIITTPGNKMDVSNGLLINDTLNADGTKTWTWEMSQPIPSYLVCVSVANYTPSWQQYTSIYGPTIPVVLAAQPADTTNMKNSFTHLQDALQIFEQKFGPYVWEKVGYVAVPFNSGAMEHATCISYPLITLNGSTTYENIMAHELSHHWFGDLVTCETAEDMWLNESWAVYCERVFVESLYGEQAYFDAVQADHENVVHYAHVDDGDYYPLSGMPQNVTYGTTTYHKGADVAHTLRSYMGDSLFFHCIKNYLTDNAFQSANSYDFRDYLSQCSGIDLVDFFHDWVFNEGFAAFWVDSFATTYNGSMYDVQIFVRQKLNHAPSRYTNVPLELTFMNSNFDTVVRKIFMSGPCATFTVQIPFQPSYVGCDLQEKISDAVVGENKFISATGANNFVYGRMNLNVSNSGGTSFVRIEHRYAPPDPINPAIPNLNISDYRYWKVEGVWGNGFDATATIQYNGSNSTAGGYLDNNLMTNSEDSVVILYRAGVHHPWTIETDIVKTIGASNDKKGFIKINHLRKGEYALAIYENDHQFVPIDVTPDSCAAVGTGWLIRKPKLDVFPNPSDGLLYVKGFSDSPVNISIYDLLGHEVWRTNDLQHDFSLQLDTTTWSKGIYFVKASGNNISPVTKRFAVIH